MKVVLGGIMIAIGVLIAGATGLCCVMLIANAGAITGPEAFVTMGLYAGLPFAAGVGLILGGVSLIRQARNERGSGQ
jgi:hypothetical protein